MFVNTSQLFINACLLLPQSYVRGLFTNYKSPQQSAFSRNSLYTFYSRNPTCEILPCLRISNRKYPPMPSDFHNREPPLPFGNPKSRPSYGMDIFWNRPIFLKVHCRHKPNKAYDTERLSSIRLEYPHICPKNWAG